MSAYEWSHEVLVKRLVEAAGRVGIANSGLTISARASSDWEEMIHLEGALLARLEGVKPPFETGEKLVPVVEDLVPTFDGERMFPWQFPRKAIDMPRSLTVYRVFYLNKCWHVSFKETNNLTRLQGPGGNTRFRADDFIKLSETEKSAV